MTSSANLLWNWNVLCATFCLLIPGSLCILRVYIRAWIKQTWILEDWFGCLSFVGLAIYTAILAVIVQSGGGKHVVDVTHEEASRVLYFVNVIQIWYGFAAGITRTTILQLYLRVFAPRRWSFFDVLIRLLFGVTWAFYGITTVVKACQCLPRPRIWDPTVAGTCLNLPAILIASGLFNIISEFVILVAPITVLWSLNVSRKRKIGIYLVFTVGFMLVLLSSFP